MATSVFVRPVVPLLWLPVRTIGPLACIGTAAAAAVLVGYMGLWSLILLLYVTAMALAVVSPARAAAALLFTAIAIEPGAVDFTRPLSLALWQMPPGFANAIPFTTSPLELVTFAAATSAFFKFRSKTQLPLLAWGVPFVMATGLAYGLRYGGASNLAYNEARGLIVGIAVFVLTSRVFPRDLRHVLQLTMFAMVVLASITILRYLVIVRNGEYTIPIEFMFSHEGSLILGIGMVIGITTLMSPNSGLSGLARLGTLSYCALLFIAMIVTGRRAATLVLIVASLSLAMIYFPLKPRTVLIIGTMSMILTTAYTAAFWNREYGAMAQPARAIRSQISPSSRDESSDIYRTVEKYDVLQTIRTNRVFGVGFGRPFYQYQSLPDMSSYWPLQSYTPHQSILWLWLKMGLFGISVFLALALTLLQRSLATLRGQKFDAEWSLAAVAFTGLLMFLIYATVDLGFAGPRAFAPAAVLAAVALRRKQPSQEDGIR